MNGHELINIRKPSIVPQNSWGGPIIRKPNSFVGYYSGGIIAGVIYTYRARKQLGSKSILRVFLY